MSAIDAIVDDDDMHTAPGGRGRRLVELHAKAIGGIVVPRRERRVQRASRGDMADNIRLDSDDPPKAVLAVITLLDLIDRKQRQLLRNDDQMIGVEKMPRATVGPLESHANGGPRVRPHS